MKRILLFIWKYRLVGLFLASAHWCIKHDEEVVIWGLCFLLSYIAYVISENMVKAIQDANNEVDALIKEVEAKYPIPEPEDPEQTDPQP